MDYLLEDGRLTIDGLSGTSAGALNVVICVDGLARGGPEEAQKRLADFWRAISIDGTLPALQRKIVERVLNFMPLEDRRSRRG
jgi:NTE family protein